MVVAQLLTHAYLIQRVCMQHMRIAHFIVESPMVIGHESSGVISEVGQIGRAHV